MNRIATILALIIFLTGCGVNHAELDRAMELRAKLLAASGCSFDTLITADFGDKTYTFAVECQSDGQGERDLLR